MKYTVTLFFISLFLMTACGPKDKELAESLITEAQTALSLGQFNVAKLKVDSVNVLYPDELHSVATGQRMLYRIELHEQKQSLSYYDTLLVKRQVEFEELTKSFIYKKGKFKGYAGTYIHKRQQVKNSHDRSYLRAYLDDKGEFYISSRYHGKSFIHHDRVKVYNDGLFAETVAIPDSLFDNKPFDDGEDCWETVNYRNGKDNGVVSFIVNNFDQKLKVQFKGQKHHYIVMEKYDKEAIRDAYNLSLIIKEVNALNASISTTEKRIDKLSSILENSKSSSIE